MGRHSRRISAAAARAVPVGPLPDGEVRGESRPEMPLRLSANGKAASSAACAAITPAHAPGSRSQASSTRGSEGWSHTVQLLRCLKCRKSSSRTRNGDPRERSLGEPGGDGESVPARVVPEKRVQEVDVRHPSQVRLVVGRSDRSGWGPRDPSEAQARQRSCAADPSSSTRPRRRTCHARRAARTPRPATEAATKRRACHAPARDEVTFRASCEHDFQYWYLVWIRAAPRANDTPPRLQERIHNFGTVSLFLVVTPSEI